MMNLFNKNTEIKDAVATEPNPYLNARRTWNHHVGSIVSSNQTWQVIGILSLFIAIAGVGGMIHIGSKSKFIPYLVEVDQLGAVKNSGVVTSTTNYDPRVMKSTVISFIENARLVTPDVALQTKAVFNVYSHLAQNDPATAKMNEWYRSDGQGGNSSPFEKAETEIVNTQIESALPQTENTWQIEWTETTRGRDGSVSEEPVNMKAVVTLYVASSFEPTSDDNPLGIYIKDYSWDRYR